MGAIYVWSLDKIFDQELIAKEEKELATKGKYSHRSYELFLTEASPWTLPDTILCMIDLPNINFLATGDMGPEYKTIRLWDL